MGSCVSCICLVSRTNHRVCIVSFTYCLQFSLYSGPRKGGVIPLVVFFFFFYEWFIQYVSCGCLLFFAGDPHGSMSFCSVFICCLWQSGRGWRFLEFAFCVCLLSALAKTQISSSKVQERMADSLSFHPVFIYCLPLAGDPCSSLSLRPVFLCCLSMAGDACSPRVCILRLFIVCL